MELTQQMHRTPKGLMAGVVATLIALGLGFMAGWFVHPSSANTQPSAVLALPMTDAGSSRAGGPGGQFGDAPASYRISREGGPGGQFGDTP
jgi:hypothetical protein